MAKMPKIPKVSLKPKLQDFFQKLKKNYPEIKKRALGTEGIVYGVVIFALMFVTVIIVDSCSPRKGDVLYGICNEFLKLQIPFPTTLQQTDVEFFPKARRIYYTHVDGYGAFQMELVECSFYQDPEKGLQLERVFFNYIKPITKPERTPGKGRLYEVKKEYIDLFNRSRSPAAIGFNDPDLVIPPRLKKGEKIPPYPQHK